MFWRTLGPSKCGATGTCVALGLLHARALLAEDDQDAATRFDEALHADYTHWPLQRARLLLSYGKCLRRLRRVSESRAPLRDAGMKARTPTSTLSPPFTTAVTVPTIGVFVANARSSAAQSVGRAALLRVSS